MNNIYWYFRNAYQQHIYIMSSLILESIYWKPLCAAGIINCCICN